MTMVDPPLDDVPHSHPRSRRDGALAGRRRGNRTRAAGGARDDARGCLVRGAQHRVLPAWLFGSLGTTALLVLGVGVLGLLAMSAAQRTRELGIRIALGATRAQVVRLLVREHLIAVLAGLVVGGILSAWAVRYIGSQRYGVKPYNPTVWTTVALTLVAVSLVGALVPSLRASRGDPVAILRVE